MPRTVVEIPQEVKEQMRRDYRRGMSLKEVSAIYGVGRNKTFYILRGSCEKKIGRKKGENDYLYENVMHDYLDGLPIKRIAKKYGFNIDWVYKALRKKGISVTDENKLKCIIDDLKKAEMTQSEIARKYNVSRQYVFQIKQKMGGNNDENLAL